MLNIEYVTVYGFEEAIRGMRNSWDSWDKSDSVLNFNGKSNIGPHDLNLMKSLAWSGPSHSKYRRMIIVYADIVAPLYWWKEFDTYKVGTVRNSCSTMHTLTKRPFELSDFSHENLRGIKNLENVGSVPTVFTSGNMGSFITPIGTLNMTISMLNACRDKYLAFQDKEVFDYMVQLLPSSYNQRATVMLNYENLACMYAQRKSHKLGEWGEFCDWIETLPYSDELITVDSKIDEE